MARKPYKPDIEYIEKYYSYGSEARVVEIKPVPKAPKPRPPKPRREQEAKVYIDPVALCALIMAVVMIIVMAVGVAQFNAVCQEYEAVRSYLTTLQDENVSLNYTYRTGYDLDEIRETALALGMVPAEEVRTITAHVTVPESEPEPTWWDNLIWFISGLFA